MIRVRMSGEVFERVFKDFYDPEVDEVKEAIVLFVVEDDMLQIYNVKVEKTNGQIFEYGYQIGGTIWRMDEDCWERLLKAIESGDVEVG